VKQVNDVRFVLMAHLGETRHSSGEVQKTGLTIFQNTNLNLRSLLHTQNGFYHANKSRLPVRVHKPPLHEFQISRHEFRGFEFADDAEKTTLEMMVIKV